jgi:hypothetical protein
MEAEFTEIDEGASYIGYEEAFKLVCSNLQPVGVEETPLDLCVGRIVSEDLVALISYPSTDVSLKDASAGMPAGDWFCIRWIRFRRGGEAGQCR